MPHPALSTAKTAASIAKDLSVIISTRTISFDPLSPKSMRETICLGIKLFIGKLLLLKYNSNIVRSFLPPAPQKAANKFYWAKCPGK